LKARLQRWKDERSGRERRTGESTRENLGTRALSISGDCLDFRLSIWRRSERYEYALGAFDREPVELAAASLSSRINLYFGD